MQTNLLHIDRSESDDSDDSDIATNDIEGIWKAVDVPVDANAHWAIALALEHNKHHKEAQGHAKEALKGVPDGLLRFRILKLLADICLSLKQFKNASKAVDECLKCEAPSKLRRQALVTRAKVEVGLKRYDDAMKSYQEAREADEDPLTGDHLQAAFMVCFEHQSDKQLIDLLRGWSPLEKLAWMTWGYVDSGDHHFFFQMVAGRSSETEFMVQAYNEVIKMLDRVGAGAPMKQQLAYAQWRVRGDQEAAKGLANEVLDITTDGYDFAFTNEDPASILVDVVGLITDVIYEQYRATADPDVKENLFAELKKVKDSKFVRSAQMSASAYNHYDIILARMAMKMMGSKEFQERLDRAFQSCVDGLMDGVGWNDWDNITTLVQVLSQIDGLEREAQILLSAQFSTIGDEAVDGEAKSDAGGENSAGEEGSDADEDSDTDGESLADDEGDLAKNEVVCNGVCEGVTYWRSWKGRVLYQCAICYDNCLCEDCYEKRISYNEGVKRTAGIEYCGFNHRYVKGPVEGWKGITNGVMSIEGMEDVKFKDWLVELKEKKWPEAWRRFWLEGD